MHNSLLGVCHVFPLPLSERTEAPWHIRDVPCPEATQSHFCLQCSLAWEKLHLSGSFHETDAPTLQFPHQNPRYVWRDSTESAGLLQQEDVSSPNSGSFWCGPLCWESTSWSRSPNHIVLELWALVFEVDPAQNSVVKPNDTKTAHSCATSEHSQHTDNICSARKCGSTNTVHRQHLNSTQYLQW